MMSAISSCSITSWEDAACRDMLAALRGEGGEGADMAGLRWLLAYCDDGVIWGRREPDRGGWRLSNGPFPQVSPSLQESNLQELRVFGAEAEVLVWRVADGFLGRRLVEVGSRASGDPTAPADEMRILLGNQLLDGPYQGFTLVGDGTGSRHAAPLACSSDQFRGRRHPLRLAVRHYFMQRGDGTVRVAVSRLIDVWIEERR